MILRTLAEAEEDIQVSFEWYEQRSSGLGLTFVDAITNAFRAIEIHPQRYPRMDASDAASEIRGYSVSKYPFVVIYEVRDDEVVVLAVAHNRRRPDYWNRRRP